MSNELKIVELAIVVVAQNHNPTILNSDYLKYNGIVPDNWEIGEGVFTSDLMSKVAFKNGITLISQLDKLVLLESLSDKNFDEIIGPTIILKYVESLPKVDYRGVGINFRGHVPMGDEMEASKYVTDHFINDGPWKAVNGTETQSSVQFEYVLENYSFSLSLVGTSHIKEDQEIPCVLLTANFHFEITGNIDEKVGRTKEALLKWGKCIDQYQSLVSTIFNGGVK